MEKDPKLKNFLFIIPHPDDEIVGVCSIIKKLIGKNNKIYLFFLTNGIVSQKSLIFSKNKDFNKLKLIRKNEMKMSLRELGIKDYFFQDIPTRTLKDRIFKTYSKIKRIITLKKINAIFCPAYEGGHQDHDVANFICSKMLKYCKVYEFPEYNYFGKKINCNSFLDNRGKEQIHLLTNKEILFKKRCINIYKSEKKNLNYIQFEKESFRPLQEYDYLHPPHTGVLFYRRYRFFSWHPRVDGDCPYEICKKIQKSKIFNF